MRSNLPKVMLHIIMPNQVSGPNNAAKLISNSFLNKRFKFGFLSQNKHAGGKVNFSLILDLKKQIEEFRPDIIHLSGLQSSAFHAVIAARLAGKKNILLTVRGSSRDAINISSFQKFVFANIIEPITLILSDRVYTVSKAMAKRGFVKRFSKNFLGTIHNPAPIIDLSSISAIEPELKLHFKNKTVISIVGRLIYDKGVTFISKAIKSLNRYDLVFVFIGDGPEIDNLKLELEIEINNNLVIFLGHRNDVISLLNESDIFLFATLHENLSNALLEASCLGLGIIATDVGGNPEVIINKKNGVLIPPKDVEEMVRAINMMVDNKELREGYCKSAKQSVVTNFSQDMILSKIEEQYNDMLKQ